MLGWLHASGRGARDPVHDARALEQRRLYDEIGEFLSANRLDASPRNFMVIHAYLSGEDCDIAARIAALLRAGGTLDDAAIAAIVEGQRATEISPDSLGKLAGALEERLEECVVAVDRSRDSQASFGSALDDEAKNLVHDPDGTLQRVIALTRDAVDATRLIEAQLKRTRRETDRLRFDLGRARRAADSDHLTGLANRRAFEGRLHEFDAEKGAPACIALCDIDDFKQVNDRFGHEAGDRVLKYVANFLLTQFGEDVLVSRYGGEEFAFLFERHDLDQAVAALDAARARLAGRSLIHQESGRPIGTITFSAGVAPIVGADPVTALRLSDLTLYAAKRTGKNVVHAAQQ